MTLTFEFIFLYILIDCLDSFSSLPGMLSSQSLCFCCFPSRDFHICLPFSRSCSALLLRSVLALTFRSLRCQLISRTCLALSLCSFSPSHKLPCDIITVYLFVLLILISSLRIWTVEGQSSYLFCRVLYLLCLPGTYLVLSTYLWNEWMGWKMIIKILGNVNKSKD